jgi:hypothetical protein
MDKNLVDVYFRRGRVEISNKGDNFRCDTIIYINDDTVWRINDDFILKNFDGYDHSRWHQPNSDLMMKDNIVIKVELKEKKSIKRPDVDPYGEEEWETEGEIILQKKWRINYNVEEIK